MLDWGTWLAAQGLPDLKPAASMRFDSYEQMIQAALSGQGVAMGIGRLVSGLMQSGQLVAPFREIVTGSRSYYIIRSPGTGDARRTCRRSWSGWSRRPRRWRLPSTAAALRSPPPAAPSAGAARRARSAR